MAVKKPKAETPKVDAEQPKTEAPKLNKDGLVPGQDVDFTTLMKMRRQVR